MKLRHSGNSPYGRKVWAAAIELGIDDRLEIVATDPNKEAGLRADNPLSKVPTLLLDDGAALFDSRVICEYLDSLAGGGRLFPAAGPARWRALRLQAIGDGICDAAVARRMDSQRPAEQQSAAFQSRQREAMTGAADLLEREAASLGGTPTIGAIAVACALGYLDLRFADDAWRRGRPQLAAWYDGFAQRPSMARTRPPG